MKNFKMLTDSLSLEESRLMTVLTLLSDMLESV